MFVRKISIAFAITGIVTIIGGIGGVAPGFYLKNYGLLGIGLALSLLLLILVIVTILLFEYQNKHGIFNISSLHENIFDKKLSRGERILLTFTNSLFFMIGIFFGILCELLLKSLNASPAIHIVIGGVVAFILLILLITILIIELKYVENSTEKPTQTDARNETLSESDKSRKVLTKPKDGPKHTASRVNRYHPRIVKDEFRSSWEVSSFNNSGTYSTLPLKPSKATSTIKKEYHELLYPPTRFRTNDKVYVNDKDIAQIISDDGLGNYQIQYLKDGLTDFKNGSELRKALPMIS